MPDRIDAVVIEEFLRSKFGSDASIDVMRPGAWSAAYRVTRYDRDALAPGAVMAIADTDIVHGAYRNDVLAVINEHSEVKEHRDTKDLIATLRANGRLALSGEERTPPAPFERSVDDYLEMLHSTSTLARFGSATAPRGSTSRSGRSLRDTAWTV